jgi:hypothetical protein
MSAARDDIEYWGLTYAQAQHYYVRLISMHTDRSARYREEAALYAHRASLAHWVLALALAVLALAIMLSA